MKITKAKLNLIYYSFLPIILLVIIILTKNILIPISLFVFCLIFMIKIGSQIVFDLDPLPFSALVILYLYNPIFTFYFIIITLPFIDLLAGRFNHHSFVNLSSLILTVFVFGFVFPKSFLLIFGILLFNIIRITITLGLGLGPQTALFSAIHIIIYMVVGSVLSFFI